MKLVDVYDVPSDVVLYRLLEERPTFANISHRKMPTWREHKKFLESRPYDAWYLIMQSETSMEVCGSVYLTRDAEIGIFLFEKHQGKGYASAAIQALMEKHPRDCYRANINPNNHNSIAMFELAGFTHIQNTYELHVTTSITGLNHLEGETVKVIVHGP